MFRIKTGVLRVAAVACCVAVGTVAAWGTLTLHNLTIDAVLNDDGSAHVTEVWDVDFDGNDATEMYTTLNIYGANTVKDFVVSEHGTAFKVVDPWDPRMTTKEHLCGIYVERLCPQLCWGLGGAGRHLFQLDYTLTAMLRHYAHDHAVLNHVFVNQGIAPEHLKLTVSRADGEFAESDIIKISTNRLSYAKPELVDGSIVVVTEQSMEKDDFLTLRAEFPLSLWGGISDLGTSTEISAAELSSPMMSGKEFSQYEETWWDKVCDFYLEWPILTLLGILFLMLGIFYLIKKIAIAMI